VQVRYWAYANVTPGVHVSFVVPLVAHEHS
jgi:hypothetical protein